MCPWAFLEKGGLWADLLESWGKVETPQKVLDGLSRVRGGRSHQGTRKAQGREAAQKTYLKININLSQELEGAGVIPAGVTTKVTFGSPVWYKHTGS